MARTTRNAKKAKISVYKPKRAGSGSMVVLTPSTTRRGKTIYTEVDASSKYDPSDEEDKSPKRKPPNTPSCSRTTASVSQEDTFQWGASSLDDQGFHEPRITKVRSML
jgi:hypothetical protein